MWTFARNSWCAIAPPIIAAAMLSRNDDSTKIMMSRTKPPFQSSGRKRGSTDRHAALLEVPRQEREAHEQQEQVREDHPLVLQMGDEPGDAGTFLEPGEHDLVGADDRQPDQRHAQGVVVEQRDAEQRERKENKVDGNRADARDVARMRHAWPRRLRATGAPQG